MATRSPSGPNRAHEKIQPLLDIGGNGGFLKHTAHLLGNGHEQVAENGQLHRIHPGAQTAGHSFTNLNFNITESADRRPAVRFDHDGGGVLDDDCRAVGDVSSQKILHPVNGGFPPSVLEVAGFAIHWYGRPIGGGNGNFTQAGHLPLGADPKIVHMNVAVGQIKPEFPAVGGLEGSGEITVDGLGDHQRRVRAVVAHVQIAGRLDPARIKSLGHQFLTGIVLQHGQPILQALFFFIAVNHGGGLLTLGHHIGHTNPVGPTKCRKNDG